MKPNYEGYIINLSKKKSYIQAVWLCLCHRHDVWRYQNWRQRKKKFYNATTDSFACNSSKRTPTSVTAKLQELRRLRRALARGQDIADQWKPLYSGLPPPKKGLVARRVQGLAQCVHHSASGYSCRSRAHHRLWRRVRSQYMQILFSAPFMLQRVVVLQPSSLLQKPMCTH